MSDFETLIGLVSRYSPSGQEQDAAGWLVTRMKSLGYDDAFVDDAGNAVGVVGQGERQVVLLGHIDTVPGEIRVAWDGGVLHGRGTVDAKGPLACFVDAVAEVGVREGWQFVVIGAVDEERDSQGARFVADRYRPDFAIIGEPSQWDRVALGYKGSARAEVTIKRDLSHPASGVATAAESAVEAWLKIKSYTDSFNVDKQRVFDKLLPTLGAIGTESNGFEQSVRMKIEVRLPEDVSAEDWYGRLGEILPGVEIDRIGFAVPAWTCEKNTLLVRAFLRGIRSRGGEPRFVYKSGTADLNVVAPVWECPSVVYGPGDSGLDHTPVEHIHFDEYEKSVQVLCSALNTLVKD